MSMHSSYIQHLHAFRGFAIINVVAAHCWSFMIFWTGELDGNSMKWLFWTTETLFHGSTLYFAIISGLLYSLVLKHKSWQTFFKSKAINIISPYVVISFATVALYWQYYVQAPEVENSFMGYLSVVLTGLVSGGASIHFWYIPVLLVLFALTPLLAALVKRNHWSLWLICLIPLLVSRSPFPEFLKPQSFIYFIGAYALGMWVGANYEHVKKLLSRWQVPLLLLVIASSLILFSLYLYNYQPTGWYSLRQTFVYLQKLGICALVILWFERKEPQLPQWIMTLGTYAFSIFFLHVIFIALVISAVQPIISETRTTMWIGLFGSANLVAGILGSVALAYIIKFSTRKYSRQIVGV